MNGVLNIDKPAGMTSHDVVNRIRRVARLKRVGHAGTLDPDATGVLLVCLGPATRLADFLVEERKSYLAALTLGTTTTTEDASGDVIETCNASHITEAALRTVLAQFTGNISQVPPMVSAVHHEGRRLYDLARQGITVERPSRHVYIDALILHEFRPGSAAQGVLEVDCGKGTYIRTLCADIGIALGVGGHMSLLRRTRVGRFLIANATPLEAITDANIADALIPPSQALAFLTAHMVTGTEQEHDIQHGRALMTELSDGTVARVVDADDTLLALARAEAGQLLPFKVFV